MCALSLNRFSNRPFRVKRFQTNHHHSSVDVAHGLVLLFGIGTRPFHHGSRRRGGTIFSNRPFRVKRFQTNHHHSSVDVAHRLVLLFGIGTRPFHHGSRRRGGTIYRAALL